MGLKVCATSPRKILSCNIVLKVLEHESVRGRTGKEETKLCLFADDTVLFVKQLAITNAYKVVGSKIKRKKIDFSMVVNSLKGSWGRRLVISTIASKTELFPK